HRRSRSDRGRRHFPPQLTSLIEGLALQKPRRSAAAIHRLARETAQQQGWPEPSYATVHSVVAALDPAMVVLALEGAKAHAQRYDLLHRREADQPNQIWQADHTELDILVLGVDGAQVRPWLTVIIDDHSRAIAAYQLTVSPPNALQTALACAGPSGARQSPAGRSAAFQRCCIPITAATSPRVISSKSAPN
ncbi:MAG: hypothetical protein EOO40_13075, partial [Deltaproteobacteria bacterium]